MVKELVKSAWDNRPYGQILHALSPRHGKFGNTRKIHNKIHHIFLMCHIQRNMIASKFASKIYIYFIYQQSVYRKSDYIFLVVDLIIKYITVCIP